MKTDKLSINPYLILFTAFLNGCLVPVIFYQIMTNQQDGLIIALTMTISVVWSMIVIIKGLKVRKFIFPAESIEGYTMFEILGALVNDINTDPFLPRWISVKRKLLMAGLDRIDASAAIELCNRLGVDPYDETRIKHEIDPEQLVDPDIPTIR